MFLKNKHDTGKDGKEPDESELLVINLQWLFELVNQPSVVLLASVYGSAPAVVISNILNLVVDLGFTLIHKIIILTFPQNGITFKCLKSVILCHMAANAAERSFRYKVIAGS